MASVCFYFQVHQPFRLRRYSVFDTDRHYFDDLKNAEILRKVAEKCYLPANKLMLETIKEHQGRFRVAFSITGTALEQFELYAPEVIASFQELNATGAVEFLDETHYHSLSFLYSREEFRAQVELHRKKIKELFGQDPRVFRNTECIYNNDVAHFVSHMGYDGIITEGADHILGYRSPNYVYRPPHAPRLRLLLKNYRLSDDIAFRFSNHQWEQYPLTAEKFAKWIHQINGNGFLCNLFMDYETLGEHQWAETGIFDFMRHLPAEVMKLSSDNQFITPSQAIDRYEPAGELDVPHMISWADTERDLSAWLGNAMQSNALNELYKLEGPLKEKGDEDLLSDWRKLSSSDHFYYMCTKHWADGDVHKYFSPYESPYDSYINYMNVLDNIQARLRASDAGGKDPHAESPPVVQIDYRSARLSETRRWFSSRDLVASGMWCATLLIVLELIVPAARQMYPEFGIPGTRISSTIFIADEWIAYHHGAVGLCAVPLIAAVVAGLLRTEQRSARDGLVGGLLGASAILLIVLSMLLTPAVLVHRQLQAVADEDHQGDVTQPQQFSGLRTLFAHLGSINLEDETAFAAGASLHVHDWDATHELLVIEPTYATGVLAPHEFSFLRGASSNGDYYVVLHDTTTGSCTLVGRLGGNSYTLHQPPNAPPTISTTWHNSSQAYEQIEYAWDGKIFKQTAQRTVREDDASK